ncbi:MAG: diguanylate cyclase [Candidatus Desulfacyla sp.]
MKRHVLLISAIWIGLVSASFAWNYFNAKAEQKNMAFQTARSFFKQILVDREWNALHGGVYVPVTKDTQPNPYLDVHLRELKTDENMHLTRINPAFMTRQIADIAARQEGIQFHITSLKPIRPENRPTAVEKNALQEFEKGEKEFGEILTNSQEDAFFYMAPLKTTASCLKCHAERGYQVGDIRGGISVTLPFIPKIPLVPLIVGHVVIGVLGLFGIAVFGTKLNRAYEAMEEQAIIDGLTGIPNRRNFSDRLPKEFDRSRREGYPLSLIMIDVDHFKAYNDIYGHQSGDECLQKVAHVIKTTLKRPGDFCARYGGEEFVVILPHTNLEGARSIAEKIRANISELKIPHERSAGSGVVTISLGLTVRDGSMPMSYEDLIKQADQALYHAKETGRNRIEVFNELS